MSKAILQHNSTVRDWAKDTKSELKNKLQNLNVRETGELLKSVRYSVGKSFGYADKIRLRFAKHGIWVEKGVGKGWPISRVKSTGSFIPGGRTPKPWLNETIDNQIPKLADQIEQVNADLILENIKIK